MEYGRTVVRCRHFNENVGIMLNDSRVKWSNCVKHLRNYISFDLSDAEEIEHKKRDFI